MTEYRAQLFVLASGQCWSPHLLLLSANARFPNGIANRSGLVGRYMNGHKFISAQATIDERDVPRPEHDAQPDLARVFPLRGRTGRSSATTRACGKAPPAKSRGCARPMAGCCLATNCSTTGARARSRAARCACAPTTTRIHRPTAGSRSIQTSKNRYGDPMPKIDRQLDAAATAREGATLAHCTEVFERMAKASNGRLTGKPSVSNYWDHPAGGCRMGADPATSVVRQLRPHARSRKPVRDRRADAADRRLHQRHADVRGGLDAFGGRRFPRLL